MKTEKQEDAITPPKAGAPLIEWALWHFDHGENLDGYSVTPIRPGGKAPYLKDWSKNPYKTRRGVERHWEKNPDDNIGLVPRPGYFWLDADDLDILENAEDEHGRLPATYTQKSINGNLHFLFKGNVTNSPTIKIDGEKLGEIRGAMSGQCVGAGSRGTTREEKPGHWEIEEFASPVDAPPWVLNLVKGSGKATLKDKRQDYGEPIDWDNQQADRLVGFVEQGELIKDYKGPIQEGERDNITFRMFAEAKNRMIHPHVMLEAIVNSGIAGGLDDETVEQKMQSVYDEGNTQDPYGKKVNSYWMQNHVFFIQEKDGSRTYRNEDPVKWKATHSHLLPKRFPSDPEPTPDAASQLPRGIAQPFYYLDMLDGIPEPTWAIEGILPEGGGSLMYGKRSTKKSFVALDIALSLATGAPFHGHGVKRGRVAYFAGEGFRGNRRRISAWFKARDLDIKNFDQDFALIPFTGKWDTENGRDLVRQILKDIEEDGPISLVIIDTARRAMSGDENAPTAVGQFLDGVSDVCREFGCGHLIIHHAGKDESKGARGGGPFEDDADAVFHVTKGGGDGVRFKCTKQKDDEADWTLEFRADKVVLGSEPDGKLITSLALSLETEAKAADDSSQIVGGKYAAHDAIAVRILKGLQGPDASGAELSTAVMGEFFPDLRESNPTKYKNALRAYRAHLTRLSKANALWPFIDQKNAKGVALTFRNPENRGGRTRIMGRRRDKLSYTPLSQDVDSR